jgi:hypothetical protein
VCGSQRLACGPHLPVKGGVVRGIELGCARWKALVGQNGSLSAQFSVLPFSFRFYSSFSFIHDYFESTLNLNVNFTFESIIQPHTLMLEQYIFILVFILTIFISFSFPFLDYFSFSNIQVSH